METELKNVCPIWIVNIITAQSAIDFLTGSSSLTSIAKKYSRGLTEQYEPVLFEYLEGITEQKLRILSEIEAAEKAVIILNSYVYRRFKFHRDNRPRKIVGLFSSALDGTKHPLLEHEEACRMFKAFIFSIRSNIYNYAPQGWTIVQEADASWLGELVAEPSSIFDTF